MWPEAHYLLVYVIDYLWVLTLHREDRIAVFHLQEVTIQYMLISFLYYLKGCHREERENSFCVLEAVQNHT